MMKTAEETISDTTDLFSSHPQVISAGKSKTMS